MPARTPRSLRRTVVISCLAGALVAPALALGGAGAATALGLPPTGISLWHDLALSNATAKVAHLDTDGLGDIWYYEDKGDDLVRIDHTTHTQTTFDLGVDTQSTGFAAAPDGSVWYSDYATMSMVHLDPSTGATESFPLPGGRFFPPSELLVDDSGTLWFADNAESQLGRISTAGVMTFVPEPTGERIVALTEGPDGRLWYTRTGPSTVGAYDPASGVFTTEPGVSTKVDSIAVSSTGDVWLGGINEFTKITPGGSTVVFPAIAPGPAFVVPTAMLADDAGGMHFVDSTYGFGTISSTGDIHFSRLDSYRTDMARDGAGHIWINDLYSSQFVWN
ncbi:MAG: hypothetical protein Q7T71_00640 [Herbiconiux sp.]|nr:hypothetical protein [Herbiconiux sp.]